MENAQAEKEGEKGDDVLVVVSKLKNYIRSASGMNTSGNVGPALSAMIRKVCDQAIENAKNDGRKTVMDRDIPTAV
ncbi:MAG: histone-like protein [Bdellovibrionota bacterium]